VHLAQSGGPAVVDRHIATRLELQTVKGCLEAEAATVDLGGKRKHSPLQGLADVAGLL